MILIMVKKRLIKAFRFLNKNDSLGLYTYIHVAVKFFVPLFPSHNAVNSCIPSGS